MNRVAGLARTLAIVAIVGTFVAWLVSIFAFGAQAHAYGRVSIPGTKVLTLPAGEVDVAYYEFLQTTGGGNVNLAIPVLDITVEPVGGGPAATLVKSYGSTSTVNNDAHERVRRMEVPRAGDYRVTVQANTLSEIDPQLWFGHGGPAAKVLGVGIIITLLLIAIALVARFGAAGAAAAVLLLTGCGSNPGATKPQVVPAATPPASEQLKYDLLTAAIQLDSYKLLEHTFTADERRLGPAFPNTVTIKTADANDFYLAAYDNHHIRYTLRRTGNTTERTCAPADANACPGGRW